MKLTVNKTDMNEAVSNIQRAVSSKTSIPALEGILLSAAEGQLELSAYDLELGITTVIPAKVQEPGRSVLSARLLSAAPPATPLRSRWTLKIWPPLRVEPAISPLSAFLPRSFPSCPSSPTLSRSVCPPTC